jgi:Caspase domain/Sel1 repeat
MYIKNCITVLFIAFFFCVPTHAKRLALVMGNDNYSYVSKLKKAGNDAVAMERELKSAGFIVQLHKDLNYRGMVKAMEVFSNSIVGGDEVLVFFAGHGVQIKGGNYLLPTDIEAGSEAEVERTAYDLTTLAEKISEAKPAFSLIIVDACRDNPLKTKGRTLGNGRGLSAIEPPKGEIIVYSAGKGQQALDRLSDADTNPNGVFTRELISRMRKPGIKVDDLMREVQNAVENLAGTVGHEQRPAIYNESRGDFYFYSPVTVQMSPTKELRASKTERDEQYWQDAKIAGNKEAYEAYLERFPNGTFSGLAKANLVKLSENSGLQAKPPKPLPLNASPELQELFRKATVENDPSAQTQLGEFYEYGKGGVSKDDLEAARLYRLSSAQGHPWGQRNLGSFYREGRGGITQNFSEALRLTQLAADAGNDGAQDILGWLFSGGIAGVVKNDERALFWSRLSAAQGNFNAENRVGIFYRDGRGGLTKNDVEAAKWFKLAAEKGHPDASLNLAAFYEDGLGGMSKNRDEAIRLYQIVARGINKVDAGKKALQRLGAAW